MPPYDLSQEAEDDLNTIIAYTRKAHGDQQMRHYIKQLEQGAENLAKGTGAFKSLPNIHPQLRFKKVEKHYIFGILKKSQHIVIIAILHERMNTLQRLKKRL